MKPTLLRVLITSIACALLLVGISFVPASLPSGNRFVVPHTVDPLAPQGPVSEGVVLTQEFVADGTFVSAVSLLVGTFGRVNKGVVTVTLAKNVGGEWQTLARKTFKKARLPDNDWYRVSFPRAKVVEPGQLLSITLEGDLDADNGIAWWTDPAYTNDKFRLLLNGSPLPGTARFSIEYAPVRGTVSELARRLWQRCTPFLLRPARGMLFAALLLSLWTFLYLTIWGTSTRSARPRS